MKSYKYTEDDLYIIHYSIGIERIKDGMISEKKLTKLWIEVSNIIDCCNWVNIDDMGYMTFSFREMFVDKYVPIILKILNKSRILS